MDTEQIAKNFVDGIIMTWKQDIESKHQYLYDEEWFRDTLECIFIDAYNYGKKSNSLKYKIKNLFKRRKND